MKALSIKQPWAWLILNGWKDIENRTWPTKYRGTILVHAGKTPDEAFDWMNMPFSPSIKGIPSYEEMGLGGLVGTVDITDCVKKSQSRWFQGPYGFTLANQKPFPELFPYKGQLGFFNVPDELVREVLPYVLS